MSNNQLTIQSAVDVGCKIPNVKLRKQDSNNVKRNPFFRDHEWFIKKNC